MHLLSAPFPPLFLLLLQASLLCKATYEGKLDRLVLLLKAGCSPDAHDYGAYGTFTALILRRQAFNMFKD